MYASINSSQKGFTLVELAISLMVIGLLIGGILKGQELIGTAKSVSLVRQIDSYQTATQIFFNKYGALPGDMPRGVERIPLCVGLCQTGGYTVPNDGRIWGGGSTQIGVMPSFSHMVNYENLAYFMQLGSAGMISGIDTADAQLPFDGWGRQAPALRDGGSNAGIMVMWNNPSTNAMGTIAAGGNYLYVRMINDGTVLKPSSALYVDQKLDNGRPNSGSVLAVGSEGSIAYNIGCVDSNGWKYNAANQNATCNLQILLTTKQM